MTVPQVPAIVLRFGGNHARRHRLLERFAQERREQVVLLAGRLDVPFAVARPVPVGLRVGLDLFHEAPLVHAGHREHHGSRHHFFPGRLADRRAGARRDIAIPGRVDHASREDRFAAGLALGDDAADDPVADDRRDEHPVQHRPHARFAYERVGDEFEHLGVERVADRLRLRHRRAHRLGAFLEFDADAFAVDRGFVPVPGETFDADLGDVAAEAAVALDEDRIGAGTRGRKRGREPRRAAAHDQHLGFRDDVGRAGRFIDVIHVF